jgi:hypothetical protein
MTQQLVFRAPTNGANKLVFEGPLLTGTTYTKTLSTTQANGNASVALLKSHIVALALSTIQHSTVLVNKSALVLKATVQAAAMSLQTGTTLAGALATTVQSTTSSVSRRVGLVRTGVQSAVASLARQFTSGSSHTTYTAVLTTTQNATASVSKGIQTIKSFTQSAFASAVLNFQSGSAHVITMTLSTVQQSLGSSTITKIFGGLHAGIGNVLLKFTAVGSTLINHALFSGTGPGSFPSKLIKDRFLDHWFRSTPWVKPTQKWWALFTSAPAFDGTGAQEVAAFGYVRVELDAGDANYSAEITPAGSGSAQLISNAVLIQFGEILADYGRIVGVGCFDAAIGGNLEGFALLDSPFNVLAGDAPPYFPPGMLKIQVL